MQPFASDPSRNPQSKASLFTFLAILFGFLWLGYRMVQPYLLSLVMGSILALLAWPLRRKLTARGLRPRTASGLVTVGVVFLVVTPLLTFASVAINQGVNAAKSIGGIEGLSLDSLKSQLTNWPPLARVVDAVKIDEYITRGLQTLGRSASEVILNMAKSIPEGSLQILLICLACYFMLVDGPRFLAWTSERIPLSKDVRLRLTETFKDTAISVVWASMAASLAQSLIMVLAYLVLGVPAAFLAGGLTFIFAFIPFAGSAPVWIGGAIYLFVQGSIVKMVLMIAFGIFTSLIDNVIRPWILKGRNEMHPFVALIAIFGGIEMFGLFGVFLGPILAAVVVTLLQIWPVIGHRYGMEFDPPK